MASREPAIVACRFVRELLSSGLNQLCIKDNWDAS